MCSLTGAQTKSCKEFLFVLDGHAWPFKKNIHLFIRKALYKNVGKDINKF